MLEHLRAEDGVHGSVGQRQPVEPREGIEVRVVPRRLSHRQIQRHVAAVREESLVGALSRSGVEQQCLRRQPLCDGAHEARDVPPADVLEPRALREVFVELHSRGVPPARRWAGPMSAIWSITLTATKRLVATATPIKPKEKKASTLA